jgi:TatA/E family protein of Tat protein translocase
MFGIGMQELAIIFVVALLIFGPKRLPELARTLGKGMAEFRRASNDLRQSFSLDNPPNRPPPTAPSRRTETPPDPRHDRDYAPQFGEATDSLPSDGGPAADGDDSDSVSAAAAHVPVPAPAPDTASEPPVGADGAGTHEDAKKPEAAGD